MEIKNWEEIERVFHTALNLDASDRQAYLSEMCAENRSLVNEVKSLIDAYEETPEFMDQPAFSLGMKVLQPVAEESLDGQSIGYYQIKTKIGSGGMGNVYLAEDTRLNRLVALKFLSKPLVDNQWAKKQLVREAQAAALLDHPNICVVHGIEEVGERQFIVMQYIEGDNLAALIRNLELTAEQVSSMIDQIVNAVAAAHAHGIIHRDIKPANIMVTHTGQVKVLDFGLAKIIQQKQRDSSAKENISQLSQNGLVIGTVAYMSPEQLRAEKLDYRSDIFSLGTVLFELVSGKHPFAQKSDAETISAILSKEPEPLTNFQKNIPSGINYLIHKCLEKNKEQRYQSASELLVELQNIKENKNQRVNRLGISPLVLVPVILILLAAFGAFLYFHSAKVQTLAVLPFINESTDSSLDYLSDGMTESLINKLSNSKQLRIKGFSIVSGYKGNNIDPVKIGRELKVDAVVTGKIIYQDNQLVMQTKVLNTIDGNQIIETQNVIRQADVLTLENEISDKIISNIQPWLTNNKEKTVQISKQTENSDAYKYYLFGRHYWKKRDPENIQKAINSFRQAIDADPSYAGAHAGLADSYVLLSSVAYGGIPTKEAMTKAKAAAKQALEIDDNLCESHTSLGIVLLKYDWNWVEAEKEFKRAIELNPDYAPAHFWYSSLLAVTGRSIESIAESEKARELDPFSSLVEINVARVNYYARQYDTALELLIKKRKTDPNDAKTLYMIGLVYIQKEMYKEAIEIFQNLYADNKLLAGAALGYCYGKAGRREDALRIIAELDQIDEQIYLPPQEKALIYIGLNEKEKAFTYLEKAYQERYAALISVKVEPLFDPLRSDQRFSELIKRMSLTF